MYAPLIRLGLLTAFIPSLLLTPAGTGAATGAGFCSEQASYSGTTITWTGGGDGLNWSDPNNWNPAQVPDAGQSDLYQSEYICIGDGTNGKPSTVAISASHSFHVAGVDVGQQSSLTVKTGGALYVGAASNADVVPSFIEADSTLELDAATLAGNAPVTVSGSLHSVGETGHHQKYLSTMTGSGTTAISSGATLTVAGSAFGGLALSGGRKIDNSGTVEFTQNGYLTMDDGTRLVDTAHSTAEFTGMGGIYPGTSTSAAPPAVVQHGTLIGDGGLHHTIVIGVPIRFGATPHVTVRSGGLVVDPPKAPKAKVTRSSGYGVGSCKVIKGLLCKQPFPTADQPQDAMLTASSESTAPKSSHIVVSLTHGPAKTHGHKVLGREVRVTAPTKKTTHSVHLTFGYDATVSGVSNHVSPHVYRNGHAVTLCKVRGLTAENTSCIVSRKVAHSGGGVKGDLTVVLITIQPDGHWLVAR